MDLAEPAWEAAQAEAPGIDLNLPGKGAVEGDKNRTDTEFR
jgi:hypothetical protein